MAAVAIATSAIACTKFEETGKDAYIPAPGETVKLTLSADKGGSDSKPATRVYVGEIQDNKVRYYWTENDRIGVIPFLTDANPNYVTEETQIMDDKNLAQFEAYITAEGYETESVDLLIYYPYNSSMLEGLEEMSTGAEYTKEGLTFRLPQEQDQHGYNIELSVDAEDRIDRHPSDWALSNYGLAYDLAASAISAEVSGGQTIANATGEFQLDHVNSYFQFNVFGSKSGTSGKDYGDGSWKISSVTLEAGHCEVDTESLTRQTSFTLTDKITIAGTYKFSYVHDPDHFNDVTQHNNNDKITLKSVAGVNTVRVTMHDVLNAPGIGSSAEDAVPAFAVINGMEIKSNPKGNLNCLKVSVTCHRYDSNGYIIGSDTRIRYYNISDIVGTDISGNYYTIDFEVCDPVESYTDLSGSGTANTYIISAPGNYSFDASVAGNARLPFGTSGSTILGIDPTNLLSKGSENYGISWLWASGISFDEIAESDNSLTDEEIVQQILNTVELSGDEGKISIGLAAGLTTSKLSGNILLALYEKNTDGTAGDIVWTWHIWLGQPQTQHYRFPATNRDYVFTNEDWYMMDRNLGAETADLNNPRSTGLFYQRSRKEPVIGFGNHQGSKNWTQNQLPTYSNKKVFGEERATWTAGMRYSNYNTLKYPMALITDIPNQLSSSEYYYAWTSSQGAKNENDVTNDTKSMFDPCPSGYRMPTVREWDNLKADIYYWISGVQGSGVFGYCQWKGLESELAGTADERCTDYASRIAGGDYYTVNDEYEREYHIVHNSGTGYEIVTRFPNTGLLRGEGEWAYMSDTMHTIRRRLR